MPCYTIKLRKFQSRMNPNDIHCENLIFSDHAINQMFKRDISVENSRMIVNFGEVIQEYRNDKPFPSCLLLGFISRRPIHLVVGVNKRIVLSLQSMSLIPNCGMKILVRKTNNYGMLLM